MQRQSYLQGKTIIVTGAAGSLGADISIRLAQDGANVLVADRDLAAAEKVVTRISEVGGTAGAAEVDVASFDSCRAMADRAVEMWGSVDGLYANAGIHDAATALTVTPENWERLISINLTGAFYSAKAALPAILENGGGTILFQASLCATNGIPATVSYSAAKGGLVSLCYQMAVDFGPSGVRVNCISPGTTRTPLVEGLYRDRSSLNGVSPEEALRRTAASYPMGRLAEPSDISGLASFMFSDDAQYISGVNIPVDGGFNAT